jgi:photosystem II stability/assembly factor-like uncharacterized protein
MKKVITTLFILMISVLVNAQTFDWEWQNPKPNGNDQNGIVALSLNTAIAFGTAGSVQKTTDGGATWGVKYADDARRDIKAAYFVNSTTGFLCGTAGLLMKTTNSGDTWNSITVSTTEDLLAVDFYDKDTGYVTGSNGAILKTTNGGASWNVSVYGTSYIYSVYVLSPSTIFLGSNSSTTGRIIRSTNYGASWQSVTPSAFTSGTVYGVSFGDANNGVAVSSGLNIYKTTDGGATWANKASLGSNVIYSVNFISPTKVIATDAGGNLCVSTDAGETWSSVNVSGAKLYDADFFDNNIYVSGSAGTILKSVDGGASFNPQFTALTQQMLRNIQFYDSNNGLACGGASSASDALGQMLITTNGGNSWALIPFNFGAQVYSFARPSLNTWYAGTGNNKIYKTTDGGVTFTSLTLPITGTSQVYWDMAASDNNTVYAGGATGKLIKTTDGGATWTTLDPGFGTNVIYKLRIAGNAIFASGAGAKLAKSTNGGTSWTALTPNIPGTFFGLGFKNANVGYVVGSSLAASKTSDGGATWTALSLPTTLKSTTSLWAVAFTDSAVWTSSINGDLLYSKDDGANWSIAPKVTSNNLFSIAVLGSNLFIAGGNGTILKCATAGSIPVELTSFSARFADNAITLNWKTATETNNLGFEIEKKTDANEWVKIGFVSGHGTTAQINQYSYLDKNISENASYRLKQIDFDGAFVYSGVVEVNTTAPVKYELGQNYPNPFNPVTNINFRVASTSKVSLKIYDALGREAATLIDGMKEAGNYTVQFDAGKLSSGIYYYTLKSGDFTDTRKMVLIK